MLVGMGGSEKLRCMYENDDLIQHFNFFEGEGIV